MIRLLPVCGKQPAPKKSGSHWRNRFGLSLGCTAPRSAAALVCTADGSGKRAGSADRGTQPRCGKDTFDLIAARGKISAA